ncbi:MAG TPA: hypothetical protein VF296_01870, partial [Gallionella sp.]
LIFYRQQVGGGRNFPVWKTGIAGRKAAPGTITPELVVVISQESESVNFKKFCRNQLLIVKLQYI